MYNKHISQGNQVDFFRKYQLMNYSFQKAKIKYSWANHNFSFSFRSFNFNVSYTQACKGPFTPFVCDNDSDIITDRKGR